jgi:transposase
VELSGGVLQIFVDYERGVPIDGLPVYDTVTRIWRHQDFFQYECEIHAQVPRVKGKDGSVRTVEVPWARPGSGFTKQFEQFAISLCQQMPIKAASRLLREHDTVLWRMVRSSVDRALERVDYSSLRRIGVDETAARRGHDYITVFVDLDERRVVYAVEGRSGVALAQFYHFLKKRGLSPSQIEEFSCDMSPAFLSGIESAFPHSRVTLDKFHLVALLSKAVDDTRKSETKIYRGFKGLRFALLRNPSKLSSKETQSVEELFLKGDYKNTGRAYALRLQFQELFTQPVEHARVFLEHWLKAAHTCGIYAIQRVARTFESLKELILNWFQTRISNGIVEGLHSVLQATKNKARGYRNPQNLITMSYLLHGKLQLNPL